MRRDLSGSCPIVRKHDLFKAGEIVNSMFLFISKENISTATGTTSHKP